MKFSKLVIEVIVCVSCTQINMAQAQSPGNSGTSVDPANWGNSATNGAAPIQEQMKQLADYLDKAKAFDRKTVKDAPAQEIIMARVNEIIDALKLQCSLKSAVLVGSSADTVGGKIYQRNLYEAACNNDMGYFLSSRDRYRKDTGKLDAPTAATSTALTCFSAEAIKNADEAKGIKSEFYCQLPDNGGGDIKAMAGKILASVGITCNVTKFQWFGIKEAAKTELTESACDNGSGFLLETALPEGSTSSSAMNCVDASRKGLDCKLTQVAKLPTLQTFKDYLAKTNIQCNTDSYNQIKVLGKESTKQRYVVEFKCAQQPNGLVAFIPLEGNTNKFESIDCPAAAKRGVKCALTIKN